MSFTQFVKPYPDGYQDFESGGTPVTAAILNTNYDGFLLALNSWAANTESDISSLGGGLTQAHQRITNLEGTVNTKSTVTIRDLLSSGTKIGTIAINGSDYDLYAPSGGGGGSSVAWNQIQQTGTKIAEVTIDSTTYDVYSPTPIDEISDLTDVSITNLQNGQILKWNSTTSKWENSNESGGGTGGHTIIDENGTSMTARAGLQFVGGVNVSDDPTNDKTIVDLASAGGIDGVFIDTENVITSGTYSNSNPLSYTATEDCIVVVPMVSQSDDATSGQTYVYVNGVEVCRNFNGSSQVVIQNAVVSLKKGQVLTATTGRTTSSMTYTVYGIQTGTTHSKFQPVIYSLEEREIGVWTDGKPLYQKTIVLESSMSIASNTWTDIDNGDWSFVDTFVLGLMVNANGASVGFVAVDKNTNNNKLRILQTRSTDITCKSVTIQYTKTSDTAGSGSWTPQGVPTHHYSTEEHIIGTWIDDKTLYEKTFYIHDRQFNSNGECDFDVTSLNSDILMADNMASYYTFSISSTEYTRQFEKLVPEEGHVYAYGPANRQIVTGYITIKYTKSS